MQLTDCDYESVLYVARHMREMDKREIYALRFADEPFHLMNDVMAQPHFSWIGWHQGLPCAVFGGMEIHPGVWSMFMFATDDFPKIALGVTRFAKNGLLPQLWGRLSAHRLQAHSHEGHRDAHRWLKRLGCEKEAVLRGYGRDGSDYGLWVLRKPLDDKAGQA